jgi:hypothetical protein
MRGGGGSHLMLNYCHDNVADNSWQKWVYLARKKYWNTFLPFFVSPVFLTSKYEITLISPLLLISEQNSPQYFERIFGAFPALQNCYLLIPWFQLESLNFCWTKLADAVNSYVFLHCYICNWPWHLRQTLFYVCQLTDSDGFHSQLAVWEMTCVFVDLWRRVTKTPYLKVPSRKWGQQVHSNSKVCGFTHMKEIYR